MELIVTVKQIDILELFKLSQKNKINKNKEEKKHFKIFFTYFPFSSLKTKGQQSFNVISIPHKEFAIQSTVGKISVRGS